MFTDKEIQESYNLLREMHSRYLSTFGVKMPSLRTGNQYTKDALVLIYLAREFPNTKVVSKDELTEFVRAYYPATADVQQARHLGMQKGWYIVSGTRGNSSSTHVGHGEYKLVSLTEPHPAFKESRRTGIDYSDFEQLKSLYDYRCATCGAKEGEPMYRYKGVITRLMKAHIDPSKPLEPGNAIPQCDNCNRAYRDWWVFDNRGRITAMAKPNVILRSAELTQLQVYELLRKKFGDRL